MHGTLLAANWMLKKPRCFQPTRHLPAVLHWPDWAHRDLQLRQWRRTASFQPGDFFFTFLGHNSAHPTCTCNITFRFTPPASALRPATAASTTRSVQTRFLKKMKITGETRLSRIFSRKKMQLGVDGSIAANGFSLDGTNVQGRNTK